MPPSTKSLPRTDWDFSALAVLARGKKGSKTPKRIAARQRAALRWELSREWRDGQIAWLEMTKEAQDYRTRRFSIPVHEVSLADFERFQREYGGKPETPEAKCAKMLRDPYSPPLPSNPVEEGERLHVLAIRWEKFGIEKILPVLEAWARRMAKEYGSKKPKSIDPMSDLWALAAFRLHEKARSGYREIADKLNALPKFKAKRGAFDADGVRKSVKEGKRLVESARPMPIRPWTDYLLPERTVQSCDRPSITKVLTNTQFSR